MRGPELKITLREMSHELSPRGRFLSSGRLGSYPVGTRVSSPYGTGVPVTGLSLGGAVPLSEHEQRLLDQIERALYAEDPKFAHAVRATSPQVHYKRRVVKAALGFFIGVCLLMA